MGAAPISRRGRVVDRGAHEGMAEFDGRGEPDQATPLRPSRSPRPMTALRRRLQQRQEHRIAQPFGGSEQQDHPSVGSQRPCLRREQPRDAVAGRQRIRQGLCAAQLLGGQRSRELDERQRVALRRGNDAAGDSAFDRSTCR